jgi:FKBP-type peptidyl-prolyl cis-trans isomerase
VYLFLYLAAVAFTACNEEDDSTEQWRKDNQTAYDAVKANTGEWTPLQTNGGPEGVYYKDLTGKEAVIGDEYPIQTATVTVDYTGWNYLEVTFDSGAKSTFNVNGVVRGFSIALQQMRAGQEWEICIPYYLGYGVSTTGSIKAYSTLFFKIKLLKINQYPE